MTDAKRWLLSAFCALLVLAIAATDSRADFVGYAVTGKGERPLPESLDEIACEELVRVRWGDYQGPRVRVGVLEVDNDSAASSLSVAAPDGQVYAYSVSDIEREVPVNGIEAMVSDALHQTGRFRVVERAALGDVLGEQDLAASGRVSQPSGAATGKVLGAEYLIQAVVTSYEPSVSGKKGGLGGITKGLFGGVKVGKEKSMIGMNFRLIDAETSELVFTKQVDVTISKKEIDLGGIGWGGSGALGGMFSTFSKTPIGQAIIAGVNIGVFELVKQIGNSPMTGSVIKVDGPKVYVNVGGDALEPGAKFRAISQGEELIDPETGLSLGSETEVLGTLELTEVNEKFSIAKTVDFDAARLSRGDAIESSASAAKMEFAADWDGKKR